jgi:gamma-glutamylaminecyclotransferase
VTVRLFVYGSLKRGFSNERFLRGAAFECAARTAQGYRLYRVGGYPALVVAEGPGIFGEVYRVTEAHLAALDAFEGVPDLYQRAVIQLEDGALVEAFVMSPASVEGCAPVPGAEWLEGPRR